METVFYFADIRVGIELRLDDNGALSRLNENELSSLRQSLYTTLNCFIYTRALFLSDMAALQKKLDDQRDLLDFPQD